MSGSSWPRRHVARTRHALLTLLVAALLGVGSLAPASPVHAVNPPPTTVGICPATEADLTTEINTLGPGSTVQFTCDTTLALTSTILIPQDFTIDGNGHNVTISGNNSVGAFVIEAGASVELSDLTIANGHTGSGGGIDNLGSVTVDNCTIISNTVTSLGGGIYNTGQLTTFGTTISGNQAYGGAGVYNNGGVVLLDVTMLSNNTASGYGAGVFTTNNGTLTVQSSTITGNSANAGATFGAGINNNSGSATIDESTIDNNSANGHNALGGGIFNNGPMTITNSIISSNSVSDPISPPFDVGGGILNYNSGVLSVSGSTIDDNSSNDSGGGIANQGTMTVAGSTLNGNSAPLDGGAALNYTTLTISTSTLGGNTAGQGAGIYNEGTTTVDGSTFSGNNASVYGGGIYNLSTVNLTNSTFSGNSASAFGGGIYAVSTTKVGNSTFSGNSAGDGGASVAFQNVTGNLSNSILAGAGATTECYGPNHDNGGNLSDDASCALTQSTSTNNATSLNLEALANYGGSTQTVALQSGSSAIDVVPLANCPSTDQRGVARPDDVGETACDSGAFESSDAPASTATPTNTPAPPTSTSTNTPVPPTNTPTATNTPVPPTATSTPVASISLSRTSGRYKDPVTVTGSGFGASETISVYLDTTASTPLTGTTSGADGSLTATFMAPQAISGTHTIIAVGQSSGRSGSAPWLELPGAYLLHYQGNKGSTDVLKGAGFAPHEIVVGYWNTTSGTPFTYTATTNSIGTFGGSASYPGITFTVPLSPTGQYFVYAVGQMSHGRAHATYTQTPALSVKPTSAAPGAVVTVAGTGYGANETVTIKYNCGTSGCSSTTILATPTTDGNGYFSTTVTLPGTTSLGAHAIGGKGGASGVFATTSITIT